MTRARLLKLHRWAGLIFGTLLLLQGITGTMLVFREEIERLIIPSLHVAPARAGYALQPIIDTVRAARPDAELLRLEFAEDRDVAVHAVMRDRETDAQYLAAIDPGSGAIVRQGGLLAWPGELVFRAHYELFAGDTGKWVIGIEGLALLFMAVTGPIIWWPGRKRLKSGLRVTLDAGVDRGVRTLHRAAGAALAVLLLVTAVTGTLMIFRAGIAPLLEKAAIAVPKPSPKVALRSGAAIMPVDLLVHRARRNHGATRLREVRFSGKQGQMVAVFLQDQGALRPNASRQIYYDGYTGKEIGRYIPAIAPAGNSFFDWLYPVHTGQAAGMVGRLVMLMSGIGLTFFTASGFWLWLSRRRQSRVRMERKAALRPRALLPRQ